MTLTRTARLLATAGAAALLLGLVVDGTAQAAPVTTVDTVTFSSSSITTSGVTMKPQTVTAHITSAQPSAWEFVLVGTGGSGTLRELDVVATRTAGTDSDGTWAGTVQVPSTAAGTWKLSAVYPASASGWGPPVTPNGSSSFTVTGHHQPRLSVGVAPNPLPYPQRRDFVKGRVVDSDTGLGMPGVTVGVAFDNGCVQQYAIDGPIKTLVEKRTNSAGYYSFGPVSMGRVCVGLWGSVRHNSDGFSVWPVFRFAPDVAVMPLVTASSASSRARTGSPGSVHGQVFDWGYWDGRGRTVQIQQLHGRTAWRTVATVNVRLNARWNGAVVLTVKGVNIFRAYTPAWTGSTASASRNVTITGT
jgi:hypothetical protein